MLFLCGYLAVGFFGKPDLIISGILFGGSIFVLVMQMLIRRIADRIQENEKLEENYRTARKTKKQMLQDVSSEIPELAVDIASKVVEREINRQDYEGFVDEFIQNVGDTSI